jgi:hypothetical protein
MQLFNLGNAIFELLTEGLWRHKVRVYMAWITQSGSNAEAKEIASGLNSGCDIRGEAL